MSNEKKFWFLKNIAFLVLFLLADYLFFSAVIEDIAKQYWVYFAIDLSILTFINLFTLGLFLMLIDHKKEFEEYQKGIKNE